MRAFVIGALCFMLGALGGAAGGSALTANLMWRPARDAAEYLTYAMEHYLCAFVAPETDKRPPILSTQ